MNWKRFSSALVVLTLVLSLFAVPVFAEEDVTITIFHTNDIHGRLIEGKYAGMGMARVATLINEVEEPLVIDAGDVFHGQVIASLEQGESVAQVMNAIGYTAMAPGNHDFNYGYERLVELDGITDFPILCANVKKDDEYLLTPYVIKEVKGKTLGFFGLATPETLWKSHPDNTAGLEFVAPVEAAEEMVAQLTAEGVDLIIAVSHLGQDESSEETSLKVAQAVEGIDLIIDGHSHTKSEDVQSTDDTLIVMANEYDKELGKVVITFSGEGVELTKSVVKKADAAEVTPDAEITALIESISAEQDVILSEVVGSTAVKLDGEREIVRAGESNLGNLITDAMVEITGADIAITNGGGMRASIDEGEITKGEVITVLPFGNFVQVKKIQGKDVVAALEHGASDWPALKGAFPHVSGLTYKINANNETGRIVDVTVNGEALDVDAYYTLATNDFMAAGGDGYTMFADAEHLGDYAGLDEVVIDYIKAKGEVAPAVEGRIVGIEKVVESYIVETDDVLWKIAEMYELDWEELATYNNLDNPHLIFPGQEILIP